MLRRAITIIQSAFINPAVSRNQFLLARLAWQRISARQSVSGSAALTTRLRSEGLWALKPVAGSLIKGRVA